MKKHTIIFFSSMIAVLSAISLFTTSCKPKSSPSPVSDSGVFYFHLHTNIDTSEADSPGYYPDAGSRYLALNVPQFFISGVMLVNANGTTYTMNNVHILKDLDSEEYIIGTAPTGTYNAVMFNVGLDAATNALAPSSFTPTGWAASSSMWYGSTSAGYMSMKVQGMYDTTATHTGVNPINFSFEIPNSKTASNMISLPTRGTGAWANYPVYNLTKGSTQFIHIICDYGKLLSVINLKTSYNSDGVNVHPSIADSLAAQVPNMFHYEE